MYVHTSSNPCLETDGGFIAAYFMIFDTHEGRYFKGAGESSSRFPRNRLLVVSDRGE